MCIPHLNGAPDELIPTGPFHSINTQIRAADADGVFSGPGSGGVVLRCDETMPRIERSRDGSAQIHVAETKDKITRVEDDLLHVIGGVESVDTTYEFDVAWTPRRIRTHGLRV